MLLLFVCCLGCDNVAESKTEALSVEEKLVGEWGNDDISFVFYKDGSLAIIVDDFVVSTENEKEVLWAVDTTSDPIYLDIIMRRNETEDEFIIPAILRFITDKKIQIVSTSDTERPISFFPPTEEDSVVLSKK